MQTASIKLFKQNKVLKRCIISVNFDSATHPMLKIISCNISLLLFLSVASSGQSLRTIPLIFRETKPISLQLAFSLNAVEKSKSDTVYFPSHLKYKNEKEGWDSISTGVRARGNFRREHCHFPPLRIKMKKSHTVETPFEGNKSFKLVLPCHGGKSGNTLILKEYLCYKLLEPVSPYFFHTRLAEITLIDQGNKNSKSFSLTGFLIEDDDLIADRLGGNVIEQDVSPKLINDTAAVVNDFFEYMIANTDWSTTGQHNSKVIELPDHKKVPLPYDFDMAGLVNAPYATVNESLEIKSVQERLYRGYCRKESVMQFVRTEYLGLEPAIMKVMSDHHSYFNNNEFLQMKMFVEQFFSILKNDNQFKNAILLSCRTN